jgi:uridylate kinase
MQDIFIISVGGSIIAPDKPDTGFLKAFHALIERLAHEDGMRFVLVAGGGAPARVYQEAYRGIMTSSANDAADWIGVMATRLNAQLLRALFDAECDAPVVTNPTEKQKWQSPILIASGWKPGFSSDNDAVLLAENYGAKTVINLSNIEKVYTDDPRKNPNATPIDQISWPEFRKMVGDDWVPGKNTPFDPVASRKAEELGLKVICAAGKNLSNLEKILKGSVFIGTVIG